MFDTPDDPTTTLRPLYEARCLFELYETPRSRSLEEVWQGKGGKTDMIFSTSFARSASVSPLSRASLIRESNQSVHWTVTSSSSDRRPKDYSDGVMNVSFRSMTSREELDILSLLLCSAQVYSTPYSKHPGQGLLQRLPSSIK